MVGVPAGAGGGAAFMPGEWDWMDAGFDNPLIYNLLYGGGGGLLGDDYLMQLLLSGGLGEVSAEDQDKLKWATAAQGLGELGQQFSQRATAQPPSPSLAPSSGVSASAQVQRQQPMSVMATAPKGGSGPQQQLSLQQILEMLKQGGLLGGMS